MLGKSCADSGSSGHDRVLTSYFAVKINCDSIALSRVPKRLARPNRVEESRSLHDLCTRAVKTASMSDLLEKLRNAGSLPSPPGIALEIIRLNQRDDIDIDELAKVVSRDPAIVAKMLRMANSSSFGRPGQVTDIRQAVMTLGLRSVNLLALSFSLASYSKGDSRLNFDYKEYWTSSAVMTTAAKVLAARYLPHFGDEAFLASILCDFGQLILAECAPKEYRPVLNRLSKSRGELHEIESNILGLNHGQLGGRLLAEWGLPPLICSAICLHHDPNSDKNADEDTTRLARLLHLSSWVAELYSDKAQGAELEAFQQLALEYFEIDDDTSNAILQETERNTPEIIELLGLESRDPAEMADIRMRATEHLVKQSLALNQQIQTVTSDAEKLKKQNVQLEERATTDALTGLRNRGYFDEALEGECDRANQSAHALSLLLLDIDHFKSVNDDYGHQCGDQLLNAISRAVQHSSAENTFVCRYGGEEIAVIVPEQNLTTLKKMAENMRTAVGKTSVRSGRETVKRTVSIGCCHIADGRTIPTPDRMIELADSELYRAKAEGRNRVLITSP